MRTTLSIDDDVLHAVRERAARERRSAGDVLSDLARQALVGARPERDSASERSIHGFRPLPPRGPVVTQVLLDQLRDEELT